MNAHEREQQRLRCILQNIARIQTYTAGSRDRLGSRLEREVAVLAS